jgi:polyisoprenoid-binding protein YceI
MKTRFLSRFGAATLTMMLALPFASAEEFSIVPNTSRVSFTSDAPFETIVGTTANVTGSIEVDPAAPGKASKATVDVDMASIRTGVDLRDEHFRSEMWLDAAKYPKSSFQLTKVELPEGARIDYDKKVQGTAHGKLTIKGVTKDVKVPVTLGLFKPNPKLAQMGLNNDVLRVKTSFEAPLADYGIKAPDNLAGLKVADLVTIALDLTALKK